MLILDLKIRINCTIIDILSSVYIIGLKPYSAFYTNSIHRFIFSIFYNQYIYPYELIKKYVS